MKILWSTGEWAEAVRQLPADGRLPARTVIVPSERVAHSLRRELLRGGRAAALAGTRFLGAVSAARAVLEAAGVGVAPGEERRRPRRLATVLAGRLDLRCFRLEQLRATPGWDEALARTLGELEGAGLRPRDLLAADDRARDLAILWSALDELAGASWTSARLLAEAAGLLEASPARWPLDGATLAAATGHEPAVQARFLRAIPRVELALHGARPLRPRHAARVAALFGGAAAAALEAARAPRARATERDLLVSYLFEDPALLLDPARPRSAGPDGTVHLEEHAGVEAELEAAADWVAREILEHRTPLGEIAVLVPARAALAGLVASRLARLPWPGGPLPVHVAGGLSAAAAGAGPRALAVVRALEGHIDAASLAALLPALRAPGRRNETLSRAESCELVNCLGTPGGSAANPRGALDWAARLAALAARLEPDASRRAGAPAGREAWFDERLRALVAAARPALDALVGVAERVVTGRPLAAIQEALERFLLDWLHLPAGGTPLAAQLAAATDELLSDPTRAGLRGHAALAAIGGALGARRAAQPRFGDPAVFVGPVAAAVGLRFRAVRVLGLCEGSLPSSPREDPVLPGAARRVLGPAVPEPADGPQAQQHALDRVLRDAGERIALSAPRTDLARSQREPSSIFLEAAAALGRPAATSGTRERLVPDAAALARDAFGPAREDAARFRRAHPVTEAAWQDLAAQGTSGRPAWARAASLDLARLEELEDGLTPLDGALGSAVDLARVPGLTADRPISPTQLETLLRCPRRYLLARLVGWREPAGLLPGGELDPRSFGDLFHKASELFFRDHGARFGDREGTLARWQRLGAAHVERAFAELAASYPLAGDEVRAQQLARLRRAFAELLEHDWDEGRPRRFVDVERAFGEDTGLPLAAGKRTLFVRGYIDRLDADGRVALVRDLKTGASHPRAGAERGPTPGRDVQLAVYGLVVRDRARAWRMPSRVAAAYVYPEGRDGRERAFRDDFDALADAAQGWLDLAARLLAARAFPATPDPQDCSFCHLRPACGEAVCARAAVALEGARGAPRDFGRMKLGSVAGAGGGARAAAGAAGGEGDGA